MKKLLQTMTLLAALLLPGLAWAQTIIKGAVKDKAGPVPGVTVQEKNSGGNGTTTDVNGQFQLRLRGTSNAILVSAISYLSQEINIIGRNNIQVTLVDDAKGLEEVVVVGFGTQKKITSTGAISTVQASDIRNTPTPNIQNTLAGRVPGFVSQQRSGQPGQTGADFYIRGVNSLASESQKPLIIVDDVEYTYDQVAQLDANEIETFTVLKDASTTAIYGIKGANGVLVITTRRGKIGKPQVNVNSQAALQQAVNTPKFLGAYQTALLRNEALANDGVAPEFSAADLEHWRTGDDPYGHPDVDWYNTIFKKSAYQLSNTVDISGGTDKVRYFVSAGSFGQTGLLRDFSKGTGAPENNYAYQRYNFRSNLDMQATKDFTLRLDITGRIGQTTEPHIATSPLSTIYSFQRLPPYAEPISNPDGSYPWAFRSRNTFWETSLIGRLALQGYDRTYRNEFNILLSGDHKLNFITKGLSVKGRIAFASTSAYARSLSRDNIPAFYYNPANGTYTIHSNNLYRLEPLTLSSDAASNFSSRTINPQVSVNYDRTFGDHHVYGLALYNLNTVLATYNSGSSTSPVIQEAPGLVTKGTTFRAGYDYKRRYLLEFDGAYNGTSSFVGKRKLGFFPAVSLGWNIAEESFFKDNIKFVDVLKVRGSYGKVGSDITKGNNYKTEQFYNSSTSYNFGETSNTAASIIEGTLGNLDITWEKSRKLDVGVDATMFKGNLSFTVDYFYDYRYDQLAPRQDVLQIIGIGLPFINSAITENRGFDGQVSYNNRKGDFNYGASFTFSIARNKVLYDGFATPRYPWLSQIGHPINQATGYTSLGLFQTQEEVDSYAHLANAKPGDIKYQDLNNDGVIDAQDMRGIGQSNLPQTVLGTNLNFGWKSFSVSALFQGSFDYSYRIASAGIIPFQGNLQDITLQRWTPATAATAAFPRLSQDLAGPSSPSNNSTFWQINAKYVRLKSIDFGYTLPKAFLTKIKIRTARVFVSGYDLVTWSNFKLYAQDPEIANNGSAGTYPVQKVYNVGLQVGL